MATMEMEKNYTAGLNCGNPNDLDIFDQVGKKNRIDEKTVLFTKDINQYETMSKNSRLDISLEVGDTVMTRIVDYNKSGIILEYGGKAYINVDFNKTEVDYINSLGVGVGETIECIVSSVSTDFLTIKGSCAAMTQVKTNTHIQSLINEEVPVKALITEWTPAGYVCQLLIEDAIIKGFMPTFQVGFNKLEEPLSIINEEFDVLIEKFNPEKGSYLVSRKKLMLKLASNNIKNVDMEKMYTGVITGQANFGLFVEFDGMNGMFYKDDLSPEKRQEIENMKIGESISFYVRDIRKDKIVLSFEKSKTPYDAVELGDVIDATVDEVKDYGAIMKLTGDLTGLLRFGDLTGLNKNAVKPGDIRKVKVMAINKKERKISLMLV